MTGQETRARVLFITRKYPPSVGGMELYSKALFEAMGRIDAGVELRKGSERLRGRPSLWQVAGFFFSSAWMLLLRARRYDAILLGDYAIASLAIVAKLATFGRVRTVVALHGNDLYFLRARSPSAALYRWLSALVVRSGAVDAAVANSRAIRDEATAAGIAAVTVVPLAAQDAPRAEATTPPAPVACRLLFTGRLIRYKGLSWFVTHVWPRLDERYELLVAGQVWDRPERDCLEGQPRIRYLGTVPYDDLPALRAEAMACIMPNVPPGPTEQDEGFGLVALEGPAVGTPTVASACGGIPDAVADGITGFLLPALDADAWVRCLDGIAGWDPARRATFAEGARRHVASHYNWDLVARRTLAVLRDEPPSGERTV